MLLPESLTRGRSKKKYFDKAGGANISKASKESAKRRAEVRRSIEDIHNQRKLEKELESWL